MKLLLLKAVIEGIRGLVALLVWMRERRQEKEQHANTPEAIRQTWLEAAVTGDADTLARDVDRLRQDYNRLRAGLKQTDADE